MTADDIAARLLDRLRHCDAAAHAALAAAIAAAPGALVGGLLTDPHFVGSELTPRGIAVDAPGRGHTAIVIDRRGNDRLAGLRLQCHGGDGMVYIGANSLWRGTMRMHGDCATAVVMGDNGQDATFHLTLWSRDTTIVIGRRTTSNLTQLVAMGEAASIVIGEDCMFSTGVWVKTSDMHCIVDIETGEVLNGHGNRGPVHIGRHVWLGQDVLVTQGVTIGDGAIIGAKSLVNRTVAARSLCVGTPAREIRSGVTWLRSHAFVAEEFAAVRKDLGLG